jgi:hypothetical protein
VSGLTPRMVTRASLAERPVPAKPSLSSEKEGVALGWEGPDGHEGEIQPSLFTEWQETMKQAPATHAWKGRGPPPSRPSSSLPGQDLLDTLRKREREGEEKAASTYLVLSTPRLLAVLNGPSSLERPLVAVALA